jgi:hypothetical protein
MKTHKKAIRWIMADIKGISPLICEYRIYLKDHAKPIRDVQCHLNPTIKDVIKKKIIKGLDNEIIYLISDNS